MRVLVVSNAAAPVVGGIEVLLTQLLPALVAKGHDITLLTSVHQLAPEQLSERDGYTIHRSQLVVAVANKDPGLLARERRRVGALLRQMEPDLIHAHDPGPNLWAVVRAAPTVPLITTLHIGLRSSGVARAGSAAELLRASTWVTGVSQQAVEEVLDLEPSLAGRTSVIENGIEVPVASAEPVVPGRLVCVGRQVRQKGFDVLLHALVEVPDATLDLLGDGAERTSLEALAQDLGLSDRVRFRGVVPHARMHDELARAQVVVVPSRFEGQPLIALEAGAVGRPVVATAVDGLGSAVLDGETGLVVPTEDVGALAAALRVLVADPERCRTLGLRAREHVGTRYGFTACVDAYDALYRRFAPHDLDAP